MKIHLKSVTTSLPVQTALLKNAKKESDHSIFQLILLTTPQLALRAPVFSSKPLPFLSTLELVISMITVTALLESSVCKMGTKMTAMSWYEPHLCNISCRT